MISRAARWILSAGAAALLMSCAVSPAKEGETPKRLSDLVENNEAVSLPYRIFGNGVFVVDLQGEDGAPLSFMIDTGATKSALYKSSLSKLGIGYQDASAMTVHGINSQGARPVVRVPKLAVGPETLTDFEMIVLEDRLDEHGYRIEPLGLIGMDILSKYRVFVDADKRLFNLIPKDLPPPRVPVKWETVELMANPFKEFDYGLHFIEIRMGNHLLPALLDTGAEDNMMNWSVSKYPTLKRARKRLYDQWVIEGALGDFDPRHMVKTKNIRSGQKFWDESVFLVVDFEGLGILGVEDQPFVIAGSPLLSEETFYIDFAENIMRFKPPESTVRGRTLTSTKAVYEEDRVEH